VERETIKSLTQIVVNFRDERNWKQFHNPRDNVLSIFIESAELAELVRWNKDSELDLSSIKEELADILYWVLLSANDFEIDLAEALRSKLIQNTIKYPIEASYGRATKYDSLKKESNP
jgi:NTP pyrophosphatase (non-canonical NTP hydrolase)